VTVDHKKINVKMFLTSFCNAELANCNPHSIKSNIKRHGPKSQWLLLNLYLKKIIDTIKIATKQVVHQQNLHEVPQNNTFV
jgi:hypothetical protein